VRDEPTNLDAEVIKLELSEKDV